jgi:pyridoxine 4-dehydrogenase
MVETEVDLWATQAFANGVSATCAELGIVVVARTPLGAGMLAGKIKSIDDLQIADHYKQLRRFQPKNFRKNLELVSALEKLTTTKGCATADRHCPESRCRAGSPECRCLSLCLVQARSRMQETWT